MPSAEGTSDAAIKIADFNSAKLPNKSWGADGMYTSLWYCAPESLESRDGCGEPADMWSVGCIMAELIARKPLLPGRGKDDKQSFAHQLKLIYDLCHVVARNGKMIWGPTDSVQQTLAKMLSIDSTCSDLLAKLLCYDANTRITAAVSYQSLI